MIITDFQTSYYFNEFFIKRSKLIIENVNITFASFFFNSGDLEFYNVLKDRPKEIVIFQKHNILIKQTLYFIFIL